MIRLLAVMLLASCSTKTEKAPERVEVYPSVLPPLATTAITDACRDEAKALGLTFGECTLILAGSSLSESTWNVDKSCEAWGNPADPCCGLTQSRRSDARAVGLSCDPSERSKNGYKCNAATGIRNLRCMADNGETCDRWGPGRTLEIGIRKHLGGNQRAFPGYVETMRKTYNDEAVRRSFGAVDVREWEVILRQRKTPGGRGEMFFR